MGPRVPFALLPFGIYLSNKVFKYRYTTLVNSLDRSDDVAM